MSGHGCMGDCTRVDRSCERMSGVGHVRGQNFTKMRVRA